MQATAPWGAKRDLMKGRGWNMLSKEWMRTWSGMETPTLINMLQSDADEHFWQIPLCLSGREDGNDCWAGSRWRCWVRSEPPTTCFPPPPYSSEAGKPWIVWRRRKQKALPGSARSAGRSDSRGTPAEEGPSPATAQRPSNCVTIVTKLGSLFF